MKNKTFLIGGVILLLIVGAIACWYRQEDISHNGRLYRNKSKLCQQLAIDYLRNIRNEPGFTDEKWIMAVDIETEIHKLCQLELNSGAIRGYKPTALEKYQPQEE